MLRVFHTKLNDAFLMKIFGARANRKSTNSGQARDEKVNPGIEFDIILSGLTTCHADVAS